MGCQCRQQGWQRIADSFGIRAARHENGQLPAGVDRSAMDFAAEISG
jgi:hypothetical protein